MSYQITVQPSGRQFVAEAGESILDAALRAGVGLPYGCKDGACGACKGRIITGSVDHGRAQSLSAADREAGMALFCSALPLSDLSIEARISGLGELPVKTLPARLEKLEKPAPDVAILHLRLPASERLEFRPGQYIDILLKDGRKRSYSLANPAPLSSGASSSEPPPLLELHIRHVPGGAFTDPVFSSMKPRDMLRFSGPHGSFFLREDSQKPMILLAGGTGFAPIKSIVETLIARGNTRPATIYWGARTRVDLYLNELAERWRAQHDWLAYVPVLSDATSDTASPAWTGRCGLVHQAVMADFPDLSGHEVYACGGPAMIDAARADFSTHCQLPVDAFFADAFTFAAQ